MAPTINFKSLGFTSKENGKTEVQRKPIERDVDIDVIDPREVYFLIMHFLSSGPCQRTYGQLWNELLEHQLLPRRYHAWYSRTGMNSGDENDDGMSFPLSYNKLVVERHPRIEKDHLVKLLTQLTSYAAAPSIGENAFTSATIPTLLGTGSYTLLTNDPNSTMNKDKHPPSYMRWPHSRADQVRGLRLREIGGGFTRHHRAPSTRAACYAIIKPSTLAQKMENIKRVRGHRNAVYCAVFDRSGRYVITGSDDRLVKVWSMETAYCLASCRGHEGDITDLAVSFNNTAVASASNDYVIRVWRLPDGLPISVLRGHTGAVTAIAFSPRANALYQLLSSSDDGTCRIWDARNSQLSPRIYVPKPSDNITGRSNVPSSSTAQPGHQIFCCAFNASGSVFVTGSSDTLARVWNACKSSVEDLDKPNHEIDILAGHENDVNYVQFSGCAVAARFSFTEVSKEDTATKFKNSWFNHDNIVTCSRDGSAIIWIPRSRRSHGKTNRWTRAYHLKVPSTPQLSRLGPRQRSLPTPRGVNMIAWSLDNRFVLAAIMDCRICVWNAIDGSLVHSLTGHTDSTYVLDVHPFNPRIAMSAGYDGKTIVWDIWEGSPVRTYEIGPFKLVDGKFSPDGTSIILSDDVGQLYILNTGQGEAQKDAKYDQFFLGDYRPLVPDTHGNFLDQETQLPPYRRNMQDLLCDSGMLPYPEPYQSLFQNRRLGFFGREWRPSAVRLSVGVDFNQDYHMLPIMDLDNFIDPLPEFVDAMDWEPEIEILSDSNDSEYHVTEDNSSGGEEQVSLSFDSVGSSEGDSEGDEDGLRRSKRKKQKAEITTSSGRRVKRKNLDECDKNLIKNNRSRKSRKGRKNSRKKSSRPQRAAARNALHLFSRITGTSAEEMNPSDSSNLSESEESTAQDSSFESEESDTSLQNDWQEHLKGKEIAVDQSVDTVNPHRPFPVSQSNGTGKKRLVIKFPNRDSSKFAKIDEEFDVEGDTSQPSVDHLDGSIRWGGVKTRTAKRLKEGENGTNGHSILAKDHEMKSSSSEIQNQELSAEGLAMVNEQHPEISEKSGNHFELKENGTPIGTKLRIKCGTIKPASGTTLEIPETEKTFSDNGVADSDSLVNGDSGLVLEDSEPGPSKRMFTAVYRRSRNRTSVENDPSNGEASTSNAGKHNGIGIGIRRARSVRSRSSVREPSNFTNLKFKEVNDASEDTSIDVEEKGGSCGEEWRSEIKTPARLRSTRKRKASSYARESMSPLSDRRKTNQLGRSSWLMMCEHEEGSRYIPQQGDEVVYLRQGHQEYITYINSREYGPWETIKQPIQAVEFCRVEDLQYSTRPGSGESCCKMTLKFTTVNSEVLGKCFKLTLPEVTGFPDFLVEKSRYDASLERNWTSRDKCRVYWKNEGDEDGSWWDGRVVNVKAKSLEFPDSPWERYAVRYRDDRDQTHQHSPWELYDSDTHWEAPHIEEGVRDGLLLAFAKLEKSGVKSQDYYGVNKLKQVSQKTSFINRFPVPLSLEIIHSRLENNYYRSMEAMTHDIEVMLSNAESYFGKNAEMSLKIKRLADWFRKTLSSF